MALSLPDLMADTAPLSISGCCTPFWFQIADEEVKLHLEDCDSIQDQLEHVLNDCIGDFPDDDKSEVAAYAAQIARAHITEQTHHGHARQVVIFSYLTCPSNIYLGLSKPTLHFIQTAIKTGMRRQSQDRPPTMLGSSSPKNVAHARLGLRGERYV